MGLWDTLRGALGWQKPLVIRDPSTPVALTDAARARLGAVPLGHGIHVETVPIDRGRWVQITEGPSQGPPPPALEPLPITVSDPDLARLHGRVLDWDGDRWVAAIPLELRARETPNPESRQYLTDQVLAVGKPAFFVAGADLPDLAARLLEVDGVRSVLLRENTATVERDSTRLSAGHGWDAIDRGVDAAIRAHLLSCGGPVDGGLSDEAWGALEGEIRQVLIERILPGVHRDGGDIELVGYSNGVVKVSMHGACRSCPSSSATLRLGVERTLREAFPGRIERVEAV